jgi:hypothetical protein
MDLAKFWTHQVTLLSANFSAGAKIRLKNLLFEQMSVWFRLEAQSWLFWQAVAVLFLDLRHLPSKHFSRWGH